MPLQVSVTIVWFCNLFLVGFLLHQRRIIRDQARMITATMQDVGSAILFANAIASRGILVPCDDCGNGMGPEDSISLIRMPNGGTYIGHASHNRDVDWGLR